MTILTLILEGQGATVRCIISYDLLVNSSELVKIDMSTKASFFQVAPGTRHANGDKLFAYAAHSEGR